MTKSTAKRGWGSADLGGGVKGQLCLEGETTLNSPAFSGVSGHLHDPGKGSTSDTRYYVATVFEGSTVKVCSCGLPPLLFMDATGTGTKTVRVEDQRLSLDWPQ